MIEVYKFGGASIADPERMRALLPIIKQVKGSLVLVVSAYGKTTNALEEVVKAVVAHDKEKARSLAKEIEEKHRQFARELLPTNDFEACQSSLEKIFEELHFAMADTKAREADFIYDQIVCMGELLSTTLLASLLKSEGIAVEWVDARKLIRTNDRYQDARVDEIKTESQITETIPPLLQSGKIVLTQGFIGSTSSEAFTTLGREGSDYTGALLASMLKADGLSIWKDVPGLLNADPRKFEKTIRIPEITFHEAIEMAFYGAQVIHPKTIKPLQNAKIPLYVRCFLKPESEGTVIHETTKELHYPPIIVLKENQTLLEITTRDFSFINEGNLSRLYQLFNQHHIKINLMQNAAISAVFAVNNDPEKLSALIKSLEEEYKVLRNENQTLLTIRHRTEAVMQEIIKGKEILLTQKTRKTIQIVFH